MACTDSGMFERRVATHEPHVFWERSQRRYDSLPYRPALKRRAIITGPLRGSGEFHGEITED